MPEANLSLSDLNAMPDPEATGLLADIFEHSPWVAEGVMARRPFASVKDLHAAMTSVVQHADHERKVALLRAHPELAGDAAREKTLTASSNAEQATAGLEALPEDIQGEFDRLNLEYRQRFGFPFIIAVRDHTLASILAAFQARLNNDENTELETALCEVSKIARIRLDSLFPGE